MHKAVKTMNDENSLSNGTKKAISTRNSDHMSRRIMEIFNDLRTRMDLAFEELTGRSSIFEPLRDYEQAHLHPLWTIKEDPDIITITVDLPYVKKENIKLQAEDNALIITAGLDKSIRFNSGFKHHKETEFQRYEQAFRLPCKIDVDNVKASFKQGIMTITAPRICNRREIQIE